MPPRVDATSCSPPLFCAPRRATSKLHSISPLWFHFPFVSGDARKDPERPQLVVLRHRGHWPALSTPSCPGHVQATSSSPSTINFSKGALCATWASISSALDLQRRRAIEHPSLRLRLLRPHRCIHGESAVPPTYLTFLPEPPLPLFAGTEHGRRAVERADALPAPPWHSLRARRSASARGVERHPSRGFWWPETPAPVGAATRDGHRWLTAGGPIRFGG